ncbi:MAG: CPBP family intramembrane metalloprotease [Phaeodactylibacter sp.]|nr:CPBP family intramembrane metalloprotease [Phaeodactylibacter sp.]
MKTVWVSLIVVALTAVLLLSNRFLSVIPLQLHPAPTINALFKYQLFVGLLVLALLIVSLATHPSSRQFLALGNLGIPAAAEKWLGINGRASWAVNALQLLLVISLATGIFMFLGVQQAGRLSTFQWSFVPVILILALCNSFSEEIIFRFFLIGQLYGAAPKLTILILSAVLFGLPHYFGQPSGVVGALMAGLLGYILAKATYETQGLGIAWSIHFVQDVLIYTALFMLNPDL